MRSRTRISQRSDHSTGGRGVAYREYVSTECVKVNKEIDASIGKDGHACRVIGRGIDVVDADGIGSKLLHQRGVATALFGIEEGVIRGELVGDALEEVLCLKALVNLLFFGGDCIEEWLTGSVLIEELVAVGRDGRDGMGSAQQGKTKNEGGLHDESTTTGSKTGIQPNVMDMWLRMGLVESMSEVGDRETGTLQD